MNWVDTLIKIISQYKMAKMSKFVFLYFFFKKRKLYRQQMALQIKFRIVRFSIQIYGGSLKQFKHLNDLNVRLLNCLKIY